MVLTLRALWTERRFRHAVAHAYRRPDLALLSGQGLDIRETSAVCSPAAFGLRYPKILIPPGLVDRLTPQQWQWMVQHERHHIRQFDIGVRWAMEVAAIVYWFNPFVWVARHEVRAAQEMAADAGVIQQLSRAERLEYGRLLLAVAAKKGNNVPSVAGMKLGHSSLARRIARIRQSPHRAVVRATTAGAVVLTVMLALSVAVVAAQGQGLAQPARFPPGFNRPQEGIAVLGGPLSGTGTVPVVMRAPTGAALQARIATDPWLMCGILQLRGTFYWAVLLGGFEAARATPLTGLTSLYFVVRERGPAWKTLERRVGSAGTDANPLEATMRGQAGWEEHA